MAIELDTIIFIIVATLRAGTPLVFAALGELIVEKAGVLNLGLEGMMLTGAVTGFVAAVISGNMGIAIAVAILAAMLVSLLFAILTLTLQANQVATGLALSIFGIGLSAFIGLDYVGTPVPGIAAVDIAGLSDLPVIGRLLFGHDVMVYLSLLLFVGITLFLYYSRAGLILRAVGEDPQSAHSLGYSVIRIRYLAVLFGGVTIAQLHLQGAGFGLSSHLSSTFPYIATIIVLVIISRDAAKIRLNAPASLAKPYHPDV